jgi:hypothetical protein
MKTLIQSMEPSLIRSRHASDRVKEGCFVGVDETALITSVRKAGETIWKKIPEWDFMGRTAEQISPWAYPFIKVDEG